MDDRLRAQRETCFRICRGVFLRRPNGWALAGTVVAILTVTVGGVAAYWSQSNVADTRVTRIEERTNAGRERLERVERKLEEIDRRLQSNQDVVLRALRALRQDLGYQPNP
jgi:hypothetical protein